VVGCRPYFINVFECDLEAVENAAYGNIE